MKYENIGREIGQLVDEKQKAYGRAFQITPRIFRILYPNGIKPEQYDDMLTLVRIMDKIVRISNGDKWVFSESPYRDIAGYGLLGTEMSECVATPEQVMEEQGEQEKSCDICQHGKRLDRNVLYGKRLNRNVFCAEYEPEVATYCRASEYSLWEPKKEGTE